MSRMKEYRLGDMVFQYLTDEEGHTGLRMIPADCPVREEYQKKAAVDSLVQVKISGDVYPGGYAQGNTMRGSESTLRLRLGSQLFRQEKEEQIIETVLRDDRGYEAVHRVCHLEGDPFVTMDVTYRNLSSQPVVLEMLSSFSITGISPYLPAGGCGSGDVSLDALSESQPENPVVWSTLYCDVSFWYMPGYAVENKGCF